MKKTALLLTALCGLAALAQAQAPADPNAPPKMLQISREALKPGHGSAHDKTEAGWPAAFAKANYQNHYIAISTVSGPNEMWFLSGWDSYAAFEKDLKETEKNAALSADLARLSQADGEHLTSNSSLFATLRDDLSYRSSVKIPEMRYFVLTTYHVKPGRIAEFVAARKMIQGVHEKLNMDEHWATYQVSSGAPIGTFLLFLPIKSMDQLDAAQEMHGKAYNDALGEADQKKLGDLMNASIESSTNTLMAFAPKMSYPPKEWAVADAFWAAPQVERAAVTAPAKAAAKVPAMVVADPKQH